jgi:hypothetical protein
VLRFVCGELPGLAAWYPTDPRCLLEQSDIWGEGATGCWRGREVPVDGRGIEGKKG